MDSLLPLKKREKTRRTFTILCKQGLLHNYLIDILQKNGWVYIEFDDLYSNKMEKSVDFAWFGASLGNEYLRYDPRIYDITTVLKNLICGSGVRGDTIEKDTVTNKHALYFNFVKYFPDVCKKHLCESWDINDVRQIRKDEVLIIRPVGPGAGGGANVSIVANMNQFINIKKKLVRFPYGLATQYITNPMLIDNKKFHLRMYWIVYPDKLGKYYNSLYKIGKIITAKNDYKNEDFSNPNIHDTHFKSTFINRYFPTDLQTTNHLSDELIQNYYSQMEEILNCAFKILEPNIKSYSETKYGFEVFGCDFMITTDNIVKLIEINARHDYGVNDLEKDNPAGFEQFCNQFYQWIYDTTVFPIFS